MKIVYLFIAVILFSASCISCTAEEVSESGVANQQVDADTGGQSGTLPPPPPPSYP